MLSFDITDRHIRIIRGTESRGRIRVSSASTIDLSEGLIVNGHIKDIPKMATIINDELKARRMDDKEAVVANYHFAVGRMFGRIGDCGRHCQAVGSYT